MVQATPSAHSPILHAPVTKQVIDTYSPLLSIGFIGKINFRTIELRTFKVMQIRSFILKSTNLNLGCKKSKVYIECTC